MGFSKETQNKAGMRLLVRLYRAEEAGMLAEILANNDIATQIQGENFSALYPVYPTGVSEIRIYVRPEQYDKAAELLELYFGKTPPKPKDGSAE